MELREVRMAAAVVALVALASALRVDATRLRQGCSSDADCSYNGDCRQGACRCDAAWDGASCGNLRLMPASRGSGLRAEDGGHNTSTWGGTVALDNATGDLHMWASQMAGQCGIAAWKINSFVVPYHTGPATINSPPLLSPSCCN